MYCAPFLQCTRKSGKSGLSKVAWVWTIIIWLKPLFARTLTYVKSGFKKWLEDLPPYTPPQIWLASNYGLGHPLCPLLKQVWFIKQVGAPTVPSAVIKCQFYYWSYLAIHVIHVTKCHLLSISYLVRSCYFILYHVIKCHVMSLGVISCHIMSYHVISCHIMSYHTISCHIMCHWTFLTSFQ
jgi:hypothetical protein